MKIKNQSSLSSKYWLLILAAICIILLGIERFSDGGGPLRFIANYTVIPMQRGISYVGRFMSGVSGNFETLEDVKKENKELQAAVNKALKEIKANGTYDKIFEKWFGKQEKK